MIIILDDNDTIQKDDWFRYLVHQNELVQMVDGEGNTSIHWQKVSEKFGECWYGTKVEDYIKGFMLNTHYQYPIRFIEFARGNIKQEKPINIPTKQFKKEFKQLVEQNLSLVEIEKIIYSY